MRNRDKAACSLVAAWMAGALGGCGAGGEAGPAGRLAIDIAPLALEGVGDVVYTIAVHDGAMPPELVWSKTIASSRYGDGRGGAAYIGPCDVSSGDNRVTLTIDRIDDESGNELDDWIDPGPITLTTACHENQDTPVVFNLTIARAAGQGFVDVGVDFEDLFCSAKLDCVDALLHDGDERSTTVVVAFACTSGAGTQTTLYLDDFVLACSDGTTSYLSPAGGPGQTDQTGAHVFQVATYRDRESLDPYDKCFWNTAIGIDEASLAPTSSCTLTGRGSASEAAWSDGTTPVGAVHPTVRWEVEVVSDGRVQCGANALGAPGGDVAIHYARPDAREAFPYSLDCGACADGGDCTPLIGGKVCAGNFPGQAGPARFAAASGGIIVSLDGAPPSDPVPLPPTYSLVGCCADACCAN